MRYEAPNTVEDAVTLMSSTPGVVRVLAGGTDLLVQLRGGRIEPDLVVDIKRIPEMKRIAVEAHGFRIGAAVSGMHLGQHEAFKAAWPGVVEAVELIGSTQIQSRCTMVGNLCNASPAADSVPAMIAAGGMVDIAGPHGRRELPVEAFVESPGKNALQPGEFVTSIYFPKPSPGTGSAYLRFIPRTEMDIAVVGVGVSLTLGKDGTCTAARVGLGAVAPTPLLVEPAANAIIGTKVDEDALNALSDACSAAARPIDDKRGTVAYRTQVAGVLGYRTADIALERARSL